MTIPMATIGRFHVLTDFHFQQRFSHPELARKAIEGGADTVQFRQKSGGIRHVLAQAKATSALCRGLGTPVVINDRIDVALASQAQGVHLGRMDFPLSDARGILGEDAIIGGTATTVDQALRTQEAGADYVGFGPVFSTRSKANPASVKGLDVLARVCEEVDIPIIAIAGITATRVDAVFQAGAHGVAVMTAVSTAQDPVAAAREIRTAIDDALALRIESTSPLHSGANGRRDALR